MSDEILIPIAAYLPELSAATGQEGAEVVGINEDACLHRQIHHLLWGVGVKELTLNIRVTIHLKAEVIQSVQQGHKGLVHTATAGRSQRYLGTRLPSTQLYRQSIRHYNSSIELHRESL